MCLHQNFEYEGGSFEVEFGGDGHFNCPQYQAHAHWSMTDGNKLFINWGQYGQYDLLVDGDAKTFAGSARGNAASWRKGNYLRELPAHDHSG